ncbi:MAG: GWxTD domain-containing protein [Candidatus Aminicenantes bacterium]|nr:GWxTD domain-containing protein [Candidatus Aminicenantes bacterium]
MRRHLALVLALALAAALPAAGQKTAVKDLAPRFQQWLDLVAYHIQPVEKDVFLKLTNDRDRDIFVETFWKQRDPTPGTPENEYKDEIEKRFKYCNEFYGRGTTREGWKTDMGRIHMVLGPPASVEHFEASIGLVPCYSWSYYGDARRDLPPQFYLLFYQRGGVGEFKLYDPVTDGPTRLILDQKKVEDPFDYSALYEIIRDLAPTLAEIAITRIPGEYNYDLSPSPRNAMLLADILESPKKDVNPSYATHFLNYKGLVSTEYLTNYVESYTTTALVDDPATGQRFLHFSMVPVDVNVDLYEPKSQFYCNFQVNVSLRKGADIVFQYNREFPLYFPEDAWDRVKASGLAVEESFPVAEGRYDLNILLTNTVGKQFSLLEQVLEVPPAKTGPALEGPFVGYKFETYPRDVHIPFKVLDKKLVVDPKKTFASGDAIAVLFNVLNPTPELARDGEARVVVKGLRQAAPVRKTYTIKLDAPAAGRVLSIPYTIPAGELEPDYYEVSVVLAGPGGLVLDQKTDQITVSPAATVGHPIANAKGIPLANQFLFRYMVAEQLEKTGRPEAAAGLYEEGYRLRPDYADGVVRYANFLLGTGAYARALEIAESLRKDEKRQFVLRTVRGRALLGLERYEEALAELLQANKLYNSETVVLNAMGRCYLKLGRKAEALDAFSASLRLNPEQPDIVQAVEDLKR